MPSEPNPLFPSATILVCLGSIAVHTDEMLGPGGHDFDRVALLSCFQNPELKVWLEQMTAMGMLPVQRMSPAAKEAVQNLRSHALKHQGRKRRGPING